MVNMSKLKKKKNNKSPTDHPLFMYVSHSGTLPDSTWFCNDTSQFIKQKGRKKERNKKVIIFDNLGND